MEGSDPTLGIVNIVLCMILLGVSIYLVVSYVRLKEVLASLTRKDAASVKAPSKAPVPSPQPSK